MQEQELEGELVQLEGPEGGMSEGGEGRGRKE